MTVYLKLKIMRIQEGMTYLEINKIVVLKKKSLDSNLMTIPSISTLIIKR